MMDANMFDVEVWQSGSLAQEVMQQLLQFKLDAAETDCFEAQRLLMVSSGKTKLKL